MGSLVRIPRRGHRAALANLLLLVLLVAGSPQAVQAQFPRTQFWVPNGPVDDLLVANGKVYLAGSFTQVGPATGAFVGFDRTLGSALQPLPEVVGFVRAVVSDGADGWYIGGSFTSVRGRSRSNLAHMDATGNLTGWNPGTNATVSCLARDPSTGIVYVGGVFTTVGGQSRIGLAAVDVNGVVTPWDAGTMGMVSALAVYEGTLYVGGSFTSVAGQTRNHAAAFDTATGALLAWNPNVNSDVNAFAPLLTLGFPSTLSIYIGGGFTSVGGSARPYLASVDGTTGGRDGRRHGSAPPLESTSAGFRDDVSASPGSGLRGGIFRGHPPDLRRVLEYLDGGLDGHDLAARSLGARRAESVPRGCGISVRAAARGCVQGRRLRCDRPTHPTSRKWATWGWGASAELGRQG